MFQSHFSLMADYNQWMNARIYDAAARLSAAELERDRGAFFGSILGTLNHLVVTDIMWLQRFSAHPANHRSLDPVRAMRTPESQRATLCSDLASLRALRVELDEIIGRWVRELSANDLAQTLEYRNSKGVVFNRRLILLVQHLFNHQTHHRGQTTTLLFQAGVDVGVTDLLTLIPSE
jgi:uncharacterized damage-inducible protein DinB